MPTTSGRKVVLGELSSRISGTRPPRGATAETIRSPSLVYWVGRVSLVVLCCTALPFGAWSNSHSYRIPSFGWKGTSHTGVSSQTV